MSMDDDINQDSGGGSRRLPNSAEAQQINNDITAACNSLGKLDTNDGTYMKDRDCKACLKEIIRILKKDTCDHVARQTLGALDVIKADMIPLINQYCDFNDGDTELFNLVVRICTNLTSSITQLFENQQIPTDPEMIKVYNKLMRGLYSFKRAFAHDTKIWTMLNTYLWHTEDEIPFERLLILLRNILQIPVEASGDRFMSNEFDTHSLCLYRMEQSGLFDTIIKIASETKRGTEYCFHIMEVVYLMLRDQNPATVASSKLNNNKRRLEDDNEDRKRLAELSSRDKRERLTASAKFVPPRFKGSLFVVNNCRALGQNSVLTGRIIDKKEDILFDTGKTELRKSKNRKPMSSELNSSVISDSQTKPSQVTYKLKVFSKLFVEKVYANYMQQIKHNLIQKKADENDESCYLWSIQYFTAFNRLLFMSLDNISETLSTSTLHFIQILITSYQDRIKIEKKRTLVDPISKRLHLALRAYREILNLIKSIEQGSEFWNTIETIKKNIFTELEYSSLILSLLQQYEESKHCPEYLKDLISTNDIFLDLLDEYASTHNPIVMEDDDDNSDQDGEPNGEVNDDANGLANDETNAEINAETDAEANGETNAETNAEMDAEANGQANGEANGEANGKKKQISKEKTTKKRKKKRKKQDLRAAHFMSRYCNPEVVRAYLNVLLEFRRNDSALNLQILKFFKRIVHECKCDVILMQVSVLNCLLEIVSYHSSMPNHDEFVALTKHLMQIFGEMITKKRWMIQELLFWKTNNDIVEIESAVDPPRMPSPVARSPLFPDDGMRVPDGQDLEDEVAEQEPVDSLEELMAELGSDSSPDHSDNDFEHDQDLDGGENVASGDAAGDDADDDEIVASLPQGAANRRVRLISSSEDSESSQTNEPRRPTKKGAFPSSDSDDLSSPPSPVPSPSPELGADLSDIPVLSDDGGEQ